MYGSSKVYFVGWNCIFLHDGDCLVCKLMKGEINLQSIKSVFTLWRSNRRLKCNGCWIYSILGHEWFNKYELRKTRMIGPVNSLECDVPSIVFISEVNVNKLFFIEQQFLNYWLVVIILTEKIDILFLHVKF